MAHYKGAAKEAGRAMNLMKKRQKEQEELEIRKKKIEDELKVGAISSKFAVHYDAIENKLKSDTIGLVTLNEMKAKQEDVVKERERHLVVKKGDNSLQNNSSQNKFLLKSKKQGPLSFAMEMDDEEEENDDDNDEESKHSNNHIDRKRSLSSFDEEDGKDSEEGKMKKFKMVKCPNVDTSFLPDREREEKEAKLREQLRQEWTERQEKIKNEDIEITYSYWDGSGHRRQVRMKKGNTIQQFLQKCLEQLRKEFNELKTSSVDRLMYVKEDLIIAHHFSFYDFIVTKARGKSGPLFSFDVHDDVRMVSDAAVEKDESHAGKVCLRSWYEKNKHIFPASRWEPYDPEKRYDKYTVSDKESAKIIVK